jgi:membrane carboxypeptidase/penicillin-binding protein
MHATFAQILKAYSAFNNDGTMVTPRIIDYYTDQSGDRIDPKSTQPTILVCCTGVCRDSGCDGEGGVS